MNQSPKKGLGPNRCECLLPHSLPNWIHRRNSCLDFRHNANPKSEAANKPSLI